MGLSRMMPLDTADDDESSATLALAPFPPCSAGGGSWRGSEKGSPSAGAACLTFPDEISSHPDPDPDGTDAGRELAALSPAPRLPETGILGPAAAFAAAAGTGTGTGSSRADATTTAAWPDAVTRSTGSAAAAAAVDEGDGGGGAIGKEEEEEEEVLAQVVARRLPKRKKSQRKRSRLVMELDLTIQCSKRVERLLTLTGNEVCFDL